MSVEPRLLLASQMQKAIEICQSEGINPTEMVWEELHVGNPETAPKVHRLVHQPTKYYFLFDFFPDGTHLTEFSPSEEKLKFTEKHSSFSTRFSYVARWAKNLAREIKAQDFIATLMQQQPLELLVSVGDDNRPFTEAEQRTLLERLDEVERHVIEVRDFNSEQAASIRQQFQVLQEELRRSGRNGWIKMFVGTVITIALKFLTNEQAQKVWHFASERLGSVYQMLPGIGNG